MRELMNRLSPGNRLIQGLNPDDRDALLAIATPVEFAPGHVFSEPDDAIEHLHFIDSGFCSSVAVLEDGREFRARCVVSNLNPKLMRDLVQALLELARNLAMQVAATGTASLVGRNSSEAPGREARRFTGPGIAAAPLARADGRRRRPGRSRRRW